MAFLRVVGTNELSPGTIREFQVAGQTIALANIQGKFFAINGVCLHRGGPIGEGELDRQVVTCPWHGWQFDVATGQLLTNPAIALACYLVEIRGEDVFVDIGQH